MCLYARDKLSDPCTTTTPCEGNCLTCETATDCTSCKNQLYLKEDNKTCIYKSNCDIDNGYFILG